MVDAVVRVRTTAKHGKGPVGWMVDAVLRGRSVTVEPVVHPLREWLEERRLCRRAVLMAEVTRMMLMSGSLLLTAKHRPALHCAGVEGEMCRVVAVKGLRGRCRTTGVGHEAGIGLRKIWR